MRRSGNNMNRLRGGYSGANSGPLLTTHLQDLDMELKLLKRKREIIEQEQNMFNRLSNNSKNQNDYEQPFYTFNQQEPKQQQFNVGNFCTAYESSSSPNYNRPQGNKRQSNTNWQSQNPPPKRFNTSQKISPWQTADTLQDFSLQSHNFKPQSSTKAFSTLPRPLMDIKPSISQRIKNRYFPPSAHKDFKPTKVTKNKPYLAKKPINHPSEGTVNLLSNANKFIAQTNSTVTVSPKIVPKPKAQTPKSKNVNNILRADRNPTLQMKGRMELALGTIVKEIKEQCTDPAILEVFMLPFIQRLIKHALRTRIRNVMMNQVIDSVTEIVDTYRKKYPKETDIELMNIAKDAHHYIPNSCSVGQLVEADDPEDFFRKNITKIMSNKLDDILGNLKKLYEGKTYDFDECMKHFPEKSDINTKTTDESDNKTKAKKENENYIPIDNKINSDIIDITLKITEKEIGDKISKLKHYAEFMDKIIEQRLPKILPRFKDELMSIMCIDKEYIGIKSLIANETKLKLQTEAECNTIMIDDEDDMEFGKFERHVKPESNSSTTKAISSKPISTLSAVITPQTAISPTTSISASEVKPKKLLVSAPVVTEKSTLPIKSETTAQSNTSTLSTNIATSDTCVLSTTAASSVADALPIGDGTLTSSDKPALNVPTALTATSTVLTASNSPSSSGTPGAPDMQATLLPAASANSADQNAQISKTPTSKDINYVKLIGRPNLPARAVIYDFLNKYKPTSIKKHKSINNLLVIGFTDKEGFEKILAANESVVGEATIIIKASEQVSNTPVQQKKIHPENKTPIQQIIQPQVKTLIKNEISESPTKFTDTSSEDIINSDRDHQISDLLTSIKKTDEDDIGVDVKNEDGNKKHVISDVLSEKTKTTSEKAPEQNIEKTSYEQNIEATSSEQNIEKTSLEQNIEATSSEQNIEKTSSAPNCENNLPEQMDTHSDTVIKQLETIAETDDVNESALNKKLKSVEEVTKANLKESGRATPTRSSSRLANTATPSTIKTRRASRLANN